MSKSLSEWKLHGIIPYPRWLSLSLVEQTLVIINNALQQSLSPECTAFRVNTHNYIKARELTNLPGYNIR